jgi:hypothetical protein
LIQTDTSLHDWLEGCGEALVLLAATDDATSRVEAVLRGRAGRSVPGSDGALAAAVWSAAAYSPCLLFDDRHHTHGSAALQRRTLIRPFNH